MEKDSAEKANTEFNNSVTSKEQDSLAEKKDNNSESVPENEVDSTKTVKLAEEAGAKPESLLTEAESGQQVEGPSIEEVAAENSELPGVEKAKDTVAEIKDDIDSENDKTESVVQTTSDEEDLSLDAEVIKDNEGTSIDVGVDKSETVDEGNDSKEAETTVAEIIENIDSEADKVETVVQPTADMESLPAEADTGQQVEEPLADAGDDKSEPVDKTTDKEGPKNTADEIKDTTASESNKTEPTVQATSKAEDSAIEVNVEKQIEEASAGESSDKDAKGTTEQPESDTDQNEYKDTDFSTFSKEDIVELVKKLGKDENPFRADKLLQQIAPFFNKFRDEDRQATLKKFVDGGGVEEDFQYKPDELSLRFDANYKLIKDKKSKKYKEQDQQRHKNLILGEQVLEELRKFVDSEESSSSFNQFKAIQQKWRDIGDVPAQNSRTLWANYNALIHRFYDQRSIYFELKELDRKKNYESKLVLCDKAEALEKVENLREAINALNDLHNDFKHLGPVPQEVQEELWQRFKTASDKVYERRKAFVHELKSELHENLVKKEELVLKIKEFVEFQSDRIKEWNEKTKGLIQLQKSWEAIGGLPKDKAKQVNKEFWSSFKKFFSNKHQFFKKLEADRDVNLEKKQALLDQAVALKDSEEWDKTANELKKLQSAWRDIGPVPEKVRKKIYEEFKACCDQFFENKRSGRKNSQELYKENLKKKKALIEQVITLKKDADKNLDEFNNLRRQFLELGYVPRKNINSIKEEYQKAIEEFLAALTVLNEKQKTEISLEAEFTNLAGSEHSEQDLYHKEQTVRRQINKLEDEIALWENNLEFFAHSKSNSTDKLREDVNKKIDVANVQLESLKRQLKMLRSL